MIINKFHNDSVNVIEQSRIDNIIENNNTECETVLPSITSLLLRFQLYSCITASNKIFLDSLAPDNSLTFLIKDKCYIHPKDVELFSYDIIEPAINHGGEAVFSHYYNPDKANPNYKIFTSVINPQSKGKLILGFFGPDYQLCETAESKFIQLVSQFRNSYRLLNKNIEPVLKLLHSNVPTIIINSITKEVLGINRLAVTLLSKPEQELLDYNYDQIQHCLLPLLNSYKLKLGNIVIADLELSVLTLQKIKGGKNKDGNFINYLNNKVITHLSNVTLAVSFLESIIDKNERQQLTNIILEESDHINNMLLYSRYLYHCQNNSSISQNLFQKLEHAIDNHSRMTNQKKDFLIHCQEKDINIIAPDGMLINLFEAILNSHLPPYRQNCKTTITFNNNEEDKKISVTFKTSFVEPLLVKSDMFDWSVYVEQLIQNLNIELNENHVIKNNRIKTKITLNY
ncbi:MAG: hypothetical protein ACE5D6_04750 [Candidatus Zixiibacteriota bacterium]